MKKIDVHAHYYSGSYCSELKKFGVEDVVGIPLSQIKSDSVDMRIRDMDESGIAVQILGLSAPNVYFQDKEFSLALAQMINDELREICVKYPDRFCCLASIPLVDMKYTLRELDRAIDKLGMDGISLGTNIDGKPIESEEFLPFFEEINRKKVPVFLHPMHPRGSEFMRDYHTAAIIGFLFETTLSVTKMVLSGLFEKYPEFPMILAHLGGTIPFLYKRIDMGFQQREAARKGIGETGKLPSDYLKKLYYDATDSHPSALQCTHQLVGEDHMVFGTDYPFSRGIRLPRGIEVIEKSDFTEEVKEKIFFRNALKLMPRLERVIAQTGNL